MRAALIAFVLAVSASAGAAADTRFVSVVEDLPLMDGLAETLATPFETAQGRIVRVEAEGAVGAGEIEAYYLETLPALGWARADGGGLKFRRSGEELEIRIGEGAPTRVTFVITPAAGAAAAP